jgi:outer membrane protein, heavy metal efflux system
MRIRAVIWTAVGVLLSLVRVQAQTSSVIQVEPLASKYIDRVSGLTIDDAVRRALEQEPAIRAVRTETDVARGMRLQAALRPNPTFSFMQQEEPAGTDNQTRLEVQWPLDLFRKSGRVAVAEREVEATELAIHERERQLAADVRMKYGEVAAAIRELEVEDNLLATIARQRGLVGARVQQGSAPAIEGNLLEVERRRIEAEQLLQAGRVERAIPELKRLLGVSAGGPLRLKDTLESLVERESERSLAGDRTSIRRPDVEEAEAQLRLADARIDRARSEGRADLTLFGGYMRMDAGFPQQGFSSTGTLERVRGLFHYVSGGAMVTLPLRNRNQGEIASAQATRLGAAENLSAVQLRAESEIAAARARDDYARRAVAVYAGETRSLAQQNVAVVSQTYELGRGTVSDVLNEQRRYLDFERAYTAALREAYEARTALRRALGDVR